MKVILTQDVEKLGEAHEVVNVADGFARNYLLPRSLAVVATRSAVANLDNMKRVGERRQSRLRTAAEEQARKLEGQTLVVPARIGSNGRLYGSIGTADIARQLKESFDIELDRKQIQLSEPIRAAGMYPVPVVLQRDVKIQLMVQVGDAPAAANTNGAADRDANTTASDAASGGEPETASEAASGGAG